MIIYLNFLGYFKYIKNFNNLIFILNKNYKIIYYFFYIYKSNSRIFTSSQKNRSLVNFSTKKIQKQKGLGKSRAGALSSPLRRSGGVSFPNYSYQSCFKKINKRSYKKSLFKLFYYFFLKQKYILIDDIFCIKINTNLFLNKIINNYFYNIKYNFIFLIYKINKKFFFSLNNIFKIKLIHIFNINPIILIKYKNLLLTLSFYNFLSNIYI